MSYTDRFTISLDTELLAAFDQLIQMKGFTNRSEAIRDLIRRRLSEVTIRDKSATCVATLTFRTEPGETTKREVEKIIRHTGEAILSHQLRAMPIERFLHVLMIRGTVAEVEAIGNKIDAVRGTNQLQWAVYPLEG